MRFFLITILFAIPASSWDELETSGSMAEKIYFSLKDAGVSPSCGFETCGVEARNLVCGVSGERIYQCRMRSAERQIHIREVGAEKLYKQLVNLGVTAGCGILDCEIQISLIACIADAGHSHAVIHQCFLRR